MTDFLLNECGDLDLTNGRVTILGGADGVRQRWLIHTRTFLGEWFLNENIGVPYIQKFFKKELSRQNIKEIFATASIAVPGILQVVSVIVDNLNVAARYCEVTVTCVIDSAEGPETGVFKYTGTVPPDACGAFSEVPSTISDLEIWFDATDDSSYSYDSDTPPNLIIENKAGAGFAKNIPNVSNGEVKVITVSPLNARPAMRFQNNPSGVDKDEALGIEGVPALRDTTGYSGDFTIFCVSKFNSGLSALPIEIRLWGLNGVDSLGTTQEYYNGYQYRSTPIYVNPGNGGMGIRSEVVGTPLAGIAWIGTVTPSVQDDSPTFRTWSLEQLTPPSKQRRFYVNDAKVVEATDSYPDVRLLNGSGLLGAVYNNTTGNPMMNFDGFIGEFLVYSRALSLEEIDAVNDYLSTKWNIPKSVP